MTENHPLYKHFTKIYEFVFKPFFFPAIKKTMAFIAEENPEKILEVGVGTGYSLEHYPANSSVTAVDISAEMVSRSKERVTNIKDKDFDILKVEPGPLPFEQSSFDMVVSFSVITVVSDPQGFLDQIRKVLKTNNKLVLIMHSRSTGFVGFLDRLFDFPSKLFLGFTLLRHIDDLNLEGWKVLDHRPASKILGYPYNHKIVMQKI